MVLSNYCRLVQYPWKLYRATNGTIYDGEAKNSGAGNDWTYVIAMPGGGSRGMTYRGEGTTGNVWVDVGIGDTPEAADDYELSDKNSGLTQVGQAKYSASTREMFSVVGTFRNDTANPITVKEVGYYGVGWVYNNGNKTFLLCRKVLDTPVVIAPGESYSFNYRLRVKDN